FLTMNVAASPMATEAVSPMITSVTPTLDPTPKDEEPNSSEGTCSGEASQLGDPRRRYQKPPPLHTGADWKVVLHLPEIETWLRATTDRVRDLTHSVHQDSLNRHVDVHLVQLKDICEDISDHVEQIHALLETEFSLKLLSYSVNIIVDIRTVQLLWHQLRVSVLVLKERLLQGLQDSNGNYTRQTDILQAFSHEHDQTRLDALTEVDDSGQLTIKCSQDYFSLDCGITAYELSDYSPSEDPERGHEHLNLYPELERDFPKLLQSVDLLTIAAECLSSSKERQDSENFSTGHPYQDSKEAPKDLSKGLNMEDFPSTVTVQCDSPQGESSVSKRPLQGSFSNEVSPTQPSLPKRAMYLEGDANSNRVTLHSSLQFQADISRSTPSLLDPPDRSKFWLDLDSVYPSNNSHSYDSLDAMNGKNMQACKELVHQRPPVSGTHMRCQRSSSEAGQDFLLPDKPPFIPTSATVSKDGAPDDALGNPKSSMPDSPELDSSDIEHCEDISSSSPEVQPPSTETCLWIVPRVGDHPCQEAHSPKEGGYWFGSDEFLALPVQLRKTEMLAQKLETLAKVLPQRPSQEPIQDVDDWELTELNQDWENGLPPLPPVHTYKKPFLMGCLSPTSSSDIAPSLDESIESGPLSDLLSEDEVGWGAPENKKRYKFATSSPVPKMEAQCKPLIQQLLSDIQQQENYHDIWGKIEDFVSKLDEFIGWLKDSLETTENWRPPKAELDSLKLYLETHLSFKLSVDSHGSLKECVLEEGRQLLEVISSHKSGLRDMLQMIAHQWQELQRQIRRQHGWMLRALDVVKEQILASEASHETDPQGEVQQSHREAQKDALDQMTQKLQCQQYGIHGRRDRELPKMPKNNSLLEFDSEYQELWDWLLDMESIVMDSHDLLMSEEQQQHLYKGNSVEMSMWLPKKTQLLAWAESLQRSGMELPTDFEQVTLWSLQQKTLSEHTETVQPAPDPRGLLSPDTRGMLGQLEGKVKELKSWLRDTELFIFNLCLRQDAEQTQQQACIQLQQFKSLCMEVRSRRKGLASVLRLCQKLLEEPEHAGAASGLEPEREGLQLLVVNLERRWEAIVMQALQWQTRLRREQGWEQVPGNLIEPYLLDLQCPAEDSWEWDEMDMDMTMVNAESDDNQNLQSELDPNPLGNSLHQPETFPGVTPWQPSLNDSGRCPIPSLPNIYQVYSLHNVELYHQPQNFVHKSSPAKARGKQPLLKGLSKDSSFSSMESLPDIIGGLLGVKRRLGMDLARRSESESGIVSEGDTETTGNSDICLLYQGDSGRVGVTVTPSDRSDSLSSEQVCNDEDIDRVLERAKKCAEYVDCETASLLALKDQRVKGTKTKTEENGEGHRRHKKEPVEILINGCCFTPESEEEGHQSGSHKEKMVISAKLWKEFDHHSQASSLDSLYAAGDVFPSNRDTLHRSTSLESWLAPCKSLEDMSSQSSPQEHSLAVGESTGELSRRTLELLKRLENIQTPLAQKMTRSISDITLQSSSMRLLGRGPLSVGAASSINESSSLTELSSTEDSSVASEDMAVQRNRLAPPNCNASYQKHNRGHQGAQNVPMSADESDANISMVVNVSCTSACTDEDEDDSDLLSSSTLTLTEEELGIKDDEEDSSVTSEEDDYNEGSFLLRLDYLKNGFMNRPKPRSQDRERKEADLGDELQCGTLSRDKLSPISAAKDRHFLSRSALKLLEAHTNAKNEGLRKQDGCMDQKTAMRSYISQFVDDIENGNVDHSHIKGKNEDDELLREEGSLFTKKGESFHDCYSLDPATGEPRDVVTPVTPLSCEVLSPAVSSLEGQLKGEIPCHSSCRPSSSLSPMEDCSNNTEEHFSSFLTDIHQIPRDETTSPDHPCCSQSMFHPETKKGEDVHNFVMEIIDMTSVALKNKGSQPESDPNGSGSPTPAAQILDKVLEHSHHSLHLRKGDFYSYLSLSSHDSDCGEVSSCTEEKSSTPLLSRTPDLHDEEPLFEACTEEVYLGPPPMLQFKILRSTEQNHHNQSDYIMIHKQE
uniref:A kinase (PRKA) anchor protein 6 n=1 Tax=Denticeps clupeoides TaxID=299321 RepID=A0AAY4A155_9TELE